MVCQSMVLVLSKDLKRKLISSCLTARSKKDVPKAFKSGFKKYESTTVKQMIFKGMPLFTLVVDRSLSFEFSLSLIAIQCRPICCGTPVVAGTIINSKYQEYIKTILDQPFTVDVYNALRVYVLMSFIEWIQGRKQLGIKNSVYR